MTLIGTIVADSKLLSWSTVKVCPAIVIVPLRKPSVLAATLKVIVPLPLPELPDVTVIHGTLLTAVRGQPNAVVTLTVLF